MSIYLYLRVVLTFLMKKNDEHSPASMADRTIWAATLPDYLNPNEEIDWSKLAKYEVIVP